jgi:diguanylate cyclase (GGDEF)-like protein
MLRDEQKEDRRLRELQRFQILDTRREPEFDGLCELARRVTGFSMAAIGFVDRERVWFKAQLGFDFPQIPREGSFCDAAIDGEGPFEIEDAGADPRFADAPVVTGAPEMRAVASIPLEVRKGIRLGTLCVFDSRPQRLAPHQVAGLRQLAGAVIDRLRLHRIRIERTREEARKRAKDAEIAAQRSEIGRQRRLLEQTSRLARIGGWEYDVGRRALVWSAEIYRILDLDRSYVPVFEEIPSFYREDVRDQMVANIRGALTRGRPFETEVPIVTAHGRPRWVRFVCEAECDRGKVSRLIGTVQDITEQRATEEEITFIATHDVMTRLPNRAVFQERLEAALSESAVDDRCCVGLLLIDIDHFKEVNDTLGHHAGDVLLGAVGRRLVQASGPDCLVARLGGDEFAVLAPDIGDEAALVRLGEVVMRELVEPVPYGDDSIPVTASVGVALARRGDGAEQLLKDADIALYEAKGAGRNRAVVFDRSMRDEIELRQAILRAIRQALERRELLLYYQPKMSLATGALYGFEALLRWRRPDGFVAGPSFFGVALEDSNISQAIGDLVLEEAARQAGEWRRAGYIFGHIAINVATSQFRRGDLADRVLEALARHGAPPQSLMVEVTENVLLSREAENVLGTLEALAANAVKIALDDFGTGYASLTHLKEFPVDLLKIDRSFVSTLADRRESRAIVRGITSLAHDLDIEVIAEGIETAQQRDLLQHLGANYGQGYLFARPMPAEQARVQFLEPQLRQAAG